MFAFASMARGYAHGSQILAEAMKMKLSDRAVRKYMKENAVTFKESPKRLYRIKSSARVVTCVGFVGAKI
jgi:hypothetical protein